MEYKPNTTTLWHTYSFTYGILSKVGNFLLNDTKFDLSIR